MFYTQIELSEACKKIEIAKVVNFNFNAPTNSEISAFLEDNYFSQFSCKELQERLILTRGQTIRILNRLEQIGIIQALPGRKRGKEYRVKFWEES